MDGLVISLHNDLNQQSPFRNLDSVYMSQNSGFCQTYSSLDFLVSHNKRITMSRFLKEERDVCSPIVAKIKVLTSGTLNLCLFFVAFDPSPLCQNTEFGLVICQTFVSEAK